MNALQQIFGVVFPNPWAALVVTVPFTVSAVQHVKPMSPKSWPSTAMLAIALLVGAGVGLASYFVFQPQAQQVWSGPQIKDAIAVSATVALLGSGLYKAGSPVLAAIKAWGDSHAVVAAKAKAPAKA